MAVYRWSRIVICVSQLVYLLVITLSIIIYDFGVIWHIFLYLLNKWDVNLSLLQYPMVLNTCSCLFSLKECYWFLKLPVFCFGTTL